MSRRGFFTATGAAILAGGSIWSAASPRVRPVALDETILSASYLYCDLAGGIGYRRGARVRLDEFVAGTGSCGRTRTNILSPHLPFSGGSVVANRLPNGLEWHGSSSPKSLVNWAPDGVVWRGTNANSLYFGGIRTVSEVVQPGRTISVSFRARISDIDGHPHPSLRISLLRTSDSRSTLLERVYTRNDQSTETCVVSLTAPEGGSGGYRLVFTGEAGDDERGASATFEIRDVMVVSQTPGGMLGPRYNVPPYRRSTYSGGDVTIRPGLAGAAFYLIVRSDEFGWIGVPTTVSSTSQAIRLSEVFGRDACITVREFYLIAQHRWQQGWMNQLAGDGAWRPIRYQNIDGSAGKSRPESPGRLSRATGYFAASSVLRNTVNPATIPSIDAPQDTWAAAFDANRWSYLSFKTDQAGYIGETSVPAGVRSELHFSGSLEYGTAHWFSFWFRCNTTLRDSQDTRKVLLFQTRYTKNPTGDSSGLGPELALEQLSGDRFCVRYRTDNGTPVLSGSGAPAGIVTRQLEPWVAPRGTWQRIVVRVTFSAAGGGDLGLWLDGRELINGPTPIGYNRQAGPKPRVGSYKFSDFPSAVEVQNFEFGQTSLFTRVNQPLPI